MNDLNPAWLALIGTVLGTSGLALVQHWLSRTKTRDDSQTKFRDDLRKEVQGLRDELWKVRKEVDHTEADLDKWREKYYELLDNFIKVKSELDEAVRGLDNLKAPVVESTDTATTD